MMPVRMVTISTGRVCKTLIFVLFSVERMGTFGRRVSEVPTALRNTIFQAVVMGTSPQCYVTFVFLQKYLKTKYSKCEYVAGLS